MRCNAKLLRLVLVVLLFLSVIALFGCSGNPDALDTDPGGGSGGGGSGGGGSGGDGSGGGGGGKG